MASYTYVETTGVIVPDTATLLDEVKAEFREAFGTDIVLTSDTPQGVLAVMETEARDSVARNNAAVANQINPDMAGGVFLDALWALTGGARVAATRSTIANVTLTGQPDTIIPEGSQARVGAAGAIFETTGAAQLSSLGTATVDFQSADPGAFSVAAGELDTIVSAVLGWETVTNANPSVLGSARESDTAGRKRRRNTLALQSVALPEAITSGLYDVADVTSVLLRENTGTTDLVIDTVTIPPKSIYACVYGGTDADVAAELLRRKSLGCGWTGDTTVDVVDAYSGQTYPVTFQRPAEVVIYAKVTVRQGSATATPSSLVRDSILAYAAGQVDGEDGFNIGVDVTPWELAGAVNIGAPGLFVTSVEIGTDPLALSSANIAISIEQVPVVYEGGISVVVVT